MIKFINTHFTINLFESTMGNSQSNKITREQVISVYGTPDDNMNCVVNTVLDIVNHGKKYTRRTTPEYRVIEDKATRIAKNNFNASPYVLITKEQVKAVYGEPDEHINQVIEDVLEIVNNNKKYKRQYTEDYQIVQEKATNIAKTHFGVDANHL